MIDYAFIKNGKVVNIAVFDNPSNELLEHFKQEFELDEIVIATENAIPNGTYDGKQFYLPEQI